MISWRRIKQWFFNWWVIICGGSALMICFTAFVLENYHKRTRNTTVYFSAQFKVGDGEWREKSCEIELEGKGEVRSFAHQVEQRIVWIIGLPKEKFHDGKAAVMNSEEWAHISCGWRAYAEIGADFTTCVPLSGMVVARTWEELAAVGVDPECHAPWYCGKVVGAEKFWEMEQRWRSFYAGMYGLDWWLPGEPDLGSRTW